MSRSRRGRERGGALIVAISFTTVMLVIAISIVELAAASRRGAIATASRVQAAAVAEAGLDEALRSIAAGTPTGTGKSFGGGNYTVTVQQRADASGVDDVHSVGTFGAESAVIDVAAVPSSTTTLLDVNPSDPSRVTILGTTRTVLVFSWRRSR